MALCQANHVGVARSDPCFELWLILHEQDFDAPDNSHQVQAHLHELRPEYDPNGSKAPDCNEVVTRVEDAEGRAERQIERREQERAPYGRPSTTVGELTREIRAAAAASSRT